MIKRRAKICRVVYTVSESKSRHQTWTEHDHMCRYQHVQFAEVFISMYGMNGIGISTSATQGRFLASQPYIIYAFLFCVSGDGFALLEISLICVRYIWLHFGSEKLDSVGVKDWDVIFYFVPFQFCVYVFSRLLIVDS